MVEASIPLTVVGGYLGAGKTTIVNHLLRHPDGRRIGVIVNDFGSIAVDAELLAGSTVDGDVVNLANGCVCCTISDGLHGALATLTERPEPPDHLVIEVSGVADPSIVAGWGTVAPFEPGGVVVVAAADDVRRLAADRYVGAEVRRQLAGADLLLVTKSDLCAPDQLSSLDGWLDTESSGAPRIRVEHGDVVTDVVLGVPAGRRVADHGHPHAADDHAADDHAADDHSAMYDRRVWRSRLPVSEADLGVRLAALPTGVLRVKGVVLVEGGRTVSVQMVGRRIEICAVDRTTDESSLVAIGLPGAFDGAADPW